MQALKRAAAVFCIACICAELLAQMTDRGWARRCIKTVAGLYILVAFWNALPQLPEREAFSLPRQAWALWKASSLQRRNPHWSGGLLHSVRRRQG